MRDIFCQLNEIQAGNVNRSCRRQMLIELLTKFSTENVSLFIPKHVKQLFSAHSHRIPTTQRQ